MVSDERKPIVKAFNPLREILNDSRTTGVLLVICTIISLLTANWFSGGSYVSFWNRTIPPDWIHQSKLPATPLEWINNFGMSLFFILAATEIKRELLSGELSSFKKAILPFGAAFGGMMMPALIYTAFNLTSSHSNGWGIPTATDIAFSVAAASLIGKRFPVGLRILLLALAIIDDLGAIVVIALFYGGAIHWIYLGRTLLTFALLLLSNRINRPFGIIQVLLGLSMWYCMLQSGIEASIAGVLFAFAIPVPTLSIVEKWIHKPVNFCILPLFALANTAILIPSQFMQSITSPVGMGVFFGLVLGKPVGIFLACRIMVGLKISQLPSNVQWNQVFGMGTLAGIGFTMSIFTTMLAFQDSVLQDISKIAVITALLASAVLSVLVFRIIKVNAPKPTAKKIRLILS